MSSIIITPQEQELIPPALLNKLEAITSKREIKLAELKSRIKKLDYQEYNFRVHSNELVGMYKWENLSISLLHKVQAERLPSAHEREYKVKIGIKYIVVQAVLSSPKRALAKKKIVVSPEWLDLQLKKLEAMQSLEKIEKLALFKEVVDAFDQLREQ